METIQTLHGVQVVVRQAPKSIAVDPVNFYDMFILLYRQASLSIYHQNKLMDFYRAMGLIGGEWQWQQEEPEMAFNNIMASKMQNYEKDAYLDALDIAIQNHTTLGTAHPLLNIIHQTQYELICK